jgi:hypothetical protein
MALWLKFICISHKFSWINNELNCFEIYVLFYILIYFCQLWEVLFTKPLSHFNYSCRILIFQNSVLISSFQSVKFETSQFPFHFDIHSEKLIILMRRINDNSFLKYNEKCITNLILGFLWMILKHWDNFFKIIIFNFESNFQIIICLI